VGGDLNAFTNKEDTVYYAAILNDHLPRAVALLCDIVFNSTFPQHEIDKEVAVICDEIESYNDTPTELIFDDFENIVFKGHPLGHNILGNAERLKQFTTADALRFTQQHYRPQNMIFFADGDISFSRLVKLLEKNLAAVAAPEGETKALAEETIPPEIAGGTVVLDKHTHQSHVMVGTRAFDIHHPLRIPLYLLNNMLGGPGMNARLNLALRERNGLVYTVESSMATYSDTGMWSVYFGCDPHDVNHCLRLVRHELDRLMQQPLTLRQLNAAKKQLKGQIGIAADNREQFALDFGKSFLHYGWEKNVERLMQHIDDVSAEQVLQTAQQLFAPERLTTLIYQY
jgi:predicted Zn-dependent peptidase